MSYILFSVVYGVKKKNKSMKTPNFVFLGQKCPKEVLKISQNYALCASLGEAQNSGPPSDRMLLENFFKKCL